MDESTASGPSATIFRGGEDRFAASLTNAHFLVRDVGVAAVTGRSTEIKLFRARQEGAVAPSMHWHDADFQYVHVLAGTIEFELAGGERQRLCAGDGIYQPKGCRHCVTWVSADLELLEIMSPADIRTIRD